MLWAIADSKKISKKIKDLITNPDNRVVISTISFWEVSLKYSLGKLEIVGFSPDDIPAACQKLGFEIESLSAEDCSTYHRLQATHHRDPFDRMLIWQAIKNDYTLISSDDTIRNILHKV